MDKKNRRFLGKSSSFRGSSSRDKKDDHKWCFNYNKHVHFIDDCLELHEDKSKKGIYQKDKFKNKVKKSIMATWDELDKEEESDKDKEEANLALMTLSSSDIESNSDSGSNFEEEDKVFFKLSRSYLITLT